MLYYFVSLINEFSESKFLGGSPVLAGAQQVAHKHARRNDFGELSAWDGTDPYRSVPANTNRFYYEIESRQVSAREVSTSS